MIVDGLLCSAAMDPVQFFRETYPTLFNRGVEVLDRSAAGGSERAKKRLEDIRAARGLANIVLEGAKDVWLRVEEGRCEAVDARDEAYPVRVAVALPADAAREALRDLARSADLESDEAAVKAAKSASAHVERTLGEEGLEFHVVLRETPDFDEVVIRVGLNVEAPPADPKFTATLLWDDLEAIRGGGLDPQQLFMGGKVKLGGDYSRALQIGMQLMQPPR